MNSPTKVIERDRTFCRIILGLLGTIMVSGSFFLSTVSHAKMRRLSPQEMSEVRGQGLMNFVVEDGTTNVTKSVGDLAGSYSSADITINTTEWTYTRLEMNVHITGEFSSGNEVARISDLKLGHYDDSGRDSNGSSSDVTHYDADGFCAGSDGDCDGQGTSFHNPDWGSGWDNKINDIYIGRSGSRQNFDQPAIKGPYVEMVWDNMQNADPSDNKLMGFRLGVEGIQGGFTLDVPRSHASGFFAGMNYDGGAGMSCAMHRGNAPVGDNCGNISWFGNGEFGCHPTNDDNCSWHGDNDAWTEDFWISLNKRDVFYEFNNPVLDSSYEPDQNQAWAKSIDAEGFWIHATDDIEGGAL